MNVEQIMLLNYVFCGIMGFIIGWKGSEAGVPLWIIILMSGAYGFFQTMIVQVVIN